MLEITNKNVDLERGEIVLRGATTKSGKTRTVPISTVRLRSVVVWFQQDAAGAQKPATAPMISNKVGEPIGDFRRLWEDTVLRAHGHEPERDAHTGALLAPSQAPLQNINLHWHDLRHEYASRLAERGVTLSEIQRLLGHASPTTTARYLSHTLARLKQSAAVLETGKTFDPKPLAARSAVVPARDPAYSTNAVDLSPCLTRVSVATPIADEESSADSANYPDGEDLDDGEPGGNRTPNPQIKSLLLCQLSYRPTLSVWPDRT